MRWLDKRRLLLTGTAVIAFMVAAVTVLVWRNPEPARFMPALAHALIENHRPPAFAQGQLSAEDWADPKQSARKLTTVLQRIFFTGTPERMLTSALLKQGFQSPQELAASCLHAGELAQVGSVAASCSQTYRRLEYHWSDGVFCGNTIYVRWLANDRAEMTRIEASYVRGCHIAMHATLRNSR